MSETIWRATDKDGRCFQYLGEKPSWDGREFNTSPEDNALVRYHGSEKPPPGECWEMNVTRKGEQPSGEAWERLVDACKAYTGEYGDQQSRVSIEARNLMVAYSAYEAQSAEQNAQQETIERLTKERDEARAEADNIRHFEKLYNLAIECVDRAFQVDSTKPPPILPNFVQIGGCKFQAVVRLAEEFAALKNELADERARSEQVYNEQKRTIDRLTLATPAWRVWLAVRRVASSSTPDRDEAESGLRSLSTHSGQVIAERDATIAELQSKLERPEMPECVAKLLDAIHRFGVLVNTSDYVQEVRDYYAPPFRITGPGVYLDSNGREVLIFLRHGKLWYGCDPETRLTTIFEESGKSGCVQLAKYLRQLEG